MKLLKIFSTVLAIATLLFSCSKDDSAESPTEVYKGSFKGSLSNYGDETQTPAGIIIYDNNKVVIETPSGSLNGTATKNGDSYDISITKTDGVFKNIDNLQGVIDTANETLEVSGTNVDDSPISLNGSVKLQTTGGWENLAKSAVHFTHDEPGGRLVSVTINGETFSGLNQHYQGGYCNNEYRGVEGFLFNLDDSVSEIHCNKVKLKGSDGNLITYTDCSTITFILDKNTSYTYTATWDTGITQTGKFTTLGGGGNLPICLKLATGGTGGGVTKKNTGKFTINGKTYSGVCYAFEDSNCSGKMSVIISANDEDDEIYFNAVPTMEGYYAISYPFNESQLCNSVWGDVDIDKIDDDLITNSGQFVKTSATTFSFNCVVKNLMGTKTYTVTGSGSY